MDAPISCPRCGVRLRLPREEDAEATHYTCPRCLASVPKPDNAAVPSPVTQHPEPVGAASTTVASELHCPSCSAVVQANWSTCPYCGEPLGDRPRRSRRSGVDADIRLDRSGIGIGTVLLAALGGLALVYLPTASGAIATSDPTTLVSLVPPLVFLVAVFAFFYFQRPQKDRSVGQALVRTLATVGALVAVLVAFVILMFIVCLVSLRGNWH
jgi:hypothetical protein